MSATVPIRRIGVLTGGGDAPGLNPAIRALVYRAAASGVEVVGIYDGWQGLLDGFCQETWALDPRVVRRWDRDGGTNLGSSRTNPFRPEPGRDDNRAQEVLRNIAALELDALVAIGGEDTLGVASNLAALGAPVIGIPKTIDKDLAATDYTLGFDTSVRTVAEIIERSRTPAGSHKWVQVVEVMGRSAGHLAYWAGLAGGANMILIPEHPFSVDRVYQRLGNLLSGPRGDRKTERYAVLVIAEGAYPSGTGEFTVAAGKDAFGHARLGGIGAWLADAIRAHTEHDARSVALGHPQRGGSPSTVDRNMGWLYGVAAAEAVQARRWGCMVSARGVAPACEISLVRLSDAVKEPALLDVARLYDTETYEAKLQVLTLDSHA